MNEERMDEIKEEIDELVERWHKGQTRIETNFKRGEYDDYSVPFFAKRKAEQRLKSGARKRFRKILQQELDRIALEVIEEVENEG